ncbi:MULTISPECIES: serine hydrolase [unclassified Knoellia]|uniref:serine hydrolase n=1 Tax=Knoellia altitudinis TaxID=3404795 RepID=UPI003622D890
MSSPRPVTRRVVVDSTLALVGVVVPMWVATRATSPGSTTHTALSTSSAQALPRATVDRAALAARLDAHRDARGGTMGLVVHDLRSGQRFAWRSFTNESLSTIKVLILVACLRKCQEDAKDLTDEQHKRARRMIQSSDNVATDSLLAWVDTANVQRAAVDLGLKGTEVKGGSAGGWWGYSTTTPDDLVTLLDAIALGTAVIHAGHRAYIRHLMAGVVPAQRWGVADPPLPNGVYTETKNGWGPLPDGYRLNSIGRVVGDGRSHTMAILTRSPQGFRYGKETISGLSKIVHEALALPL